MSPSRDRKTQQKSSKVASKPEAYQNLIGSYPVTPSQFQYTNQASGYLYQQSYPPSQGQTSNQTIQYSTQHQPYGRPKEPKKSGEYGDKRSQDRGKYDNQKKYGNRKGDSSSSSPKRRSDRQYLDKRSRGGGGNDDYYGGNDGSKKVKGGYDRYDNN